MRICPRSFLHRYTVAAISKPFGQSRIPGSNNRNFNRIVSLTVVVVSVRAKVKSMKMIPLSFTDESEGENSNVFDVPSWFGHSGVCFYGLEIQGGSRKLPFLRRFRRGSGRRGRLSPHPAQSIWERLL